MYKEASFPRHLTFPGCLKEIFPRHGEFSLNFACSSTLKVQMRPGRASQVSALSSLSTHVTACTAEAMPRCNVSGWRCAGRSISILISQHGFQFHCVVGGGLTRRTTSLFASLIRFLTQVSDVRVQLPNKVCRWPLLLHQR